jgi:hypothetical protein
MRVPVKKTAIQVLLPASVVAALLAFMHYAPISRWEDMFWRAVQNYGHVPLFAVLTIALFFLLKHTLHLDAPLLYPAAFGGAMFLGFLSEVAQIVGPREAEFMDLVRDALGSAGALAFLLRREPVAAIPPKIRFFAPLAGIVLLLAPLPPVITAYATLTYRDNSFPRICSFESRWDRRLLHTNDVAVEEVAPPPGWEQADGERVGKVTFQRTESWPGFGWEEPHPDWRGYEYFTFEVYSTIDTTRWIRVRINDRDHDQNYADRFSRRFDITPGATTVRIPLAEVAHAPEGRAMMMDHIGMVLVFAAQDAKPFTLYFDNFRLER